MELEHEGAPVAFTLIKPGPIDTPFPLNARNDLNRALQHVPPVYAAATPQREVFVGGGGRGMAGLGMLAPGLAEKGMAASVIPLRRCGNGAITRARQGREHLYRSGVALARGAPGAAGRGCGGPAVAGGSAALRPQTIY